MSDLSEEGEEELEARSAPASGTTSPTFHGTLSKWTNYIHGWQERYISLKDGTLSYYKSENETAYGCRGAISIRKANVKLHEFDECRFDVSVGDCVWYLRAENLDARNKWVEAIENYKQYIDSAYGSENSLRRHGSALSLGSVSVASLKKGRGLHEKLAEVETYRDILCRQVDSLQGYLDAAALHSGAVNANKVNGHGNSDLDEGESSNNADIDADVELEHLTGRKNGMTGNVALDFKGEAITFKATTAGILATLTQCIELMQQRDETWKKRFDREVERRRRLEETLKQHSGAEVSNVSQNLGPDFEEGPHSKIKEEEFFDALDAMLDRHDQQQEEKRQLKIRVKEIGEPSCSLPETCDHVLWPEVEKTTTDQLYFARLEVGEGDDSAGWQLFAEEGEMKLFRRELEVEGLVCDPLKAVHTVKGITGHEMCYHFFSPDVRWEWENTLENMKVVEEINPNTLIFHQIHKRVWPAAQRDAVFWSHIRRATDIDTTADSSGLHNVWVVCNNSTDLPNIPLGRCVRMTMTVSLTCETYITPRTDGREITRDDITCKIIYCSTINPGGWAPASVLRALYKREYPKFLKRFTQYVIDAQEKKPILF